MTSSARMLLAFAFVAFSLNAHAIVDMRNANYSESWIDLQVKGSSYDLRAHRTYNSRTLYSGIFGFGWCSEFETQMKVTAEGTLKVTDCGAGLETEFLPDSYDGGSIDRTVKSIVAEMRKRNPGRDSRYFTNLERDLKLYEQFRDEMARELNMKGSTQSGKRYVSRGKATDHISFKSGQYLRSLSDGSFQRFDANGRLVQINDRNGNFIKLNYKGDKISTVTDSSGASLTLNYYPNSKFVKQIVGPGKQAATYVFDNENLVSVTNAWNNTYKYQYDDLYNLTKITYPDSSTIEISYDKDKDWVVGFKDRRGCFEKYAYKDSAKDPLNNYSSAVEKKCDGKVTNRSAFEFWHKVRKDGSRYLAKTKSTINDRVTETTYHEEFGRPIEITDNNITTRFEYFPNGLLKKKTNPFQAFNYKYETQCGKVAEVDVTYQTAGTDDKGRKPTKAESKSLNTKFLWDTKRCNLMTAKNSDGMIVNLNYDLKGRITKITDQSKRDLLITYEERFGKPATISRPGLGTVKFKYNPDGSVEKMDSDEDPRIAIQVANMFSNTLEIIAPATTDGNNI